MSEYDMSIHTNPDARVWAKFFMETWEKIGRPLPDEEMMIGWFANAMMAMHDHLKPNEAADKITALRAEVERREQSFDVRWKASMRAIKRWQEAHPGNDLNWPDHADLVVWLLERDAALHAENERLLAANKDSMLHFDVLKADYEKMRAAGQALVAFYEGPLEAKRPDVFHRLMVRLNAALSPAVREGE